MDKKYIVLKAALVVAIMLSVGVIVAQPGGSGGGGTGSGGPPPPPGTGAPIDGGASFLLAGVALYAHRKLKGNQSSQLLKLS